MQIIIHSAGDGMFRAIEVVVFLFCLAGLCAQTTNWQWAVGTGSSLDDWCADVKADDLGNTYITGMFQDTVTFGGFNLASNGSFDTFVAKLDQDGNYLWAVSAGGDQQDVPAGLGLDASGNVYISGYFNYTAQFGQTTLTVSGQIDGFIAKLSNDGVWQWAKKCGGAGLDNCSDIAVDAQGNVFVCGTYSDSAHFGEIVLNGSGYEIFAVKLNSIGNWIWACGAGGSSSENASALTLDSSGNILVTGQFYGTCAFGGHSISSGNSYDAFLAKLSPTGEWQWAIRAGGQLFDSGTGVAADSEGNVYAVGVFRRIAAFGELTLETNDDTDAYIAKADPDGNWIWARQAGSPYTDVCSDVCTDALGHVYFCGSYILTAVFGNQTFTSLGDSDLFISKLDSSGNWLWTVSTGGSGYDDVYGIYSNDSGGVLIAGRYSESVTLGDVTLSSTGDSDILSASLSENVAIPDETAPPAGMVTLAVYPNPVRDVARIEVSLKESARIIVDVYNLRGQKIAEIVNGLQPQGKASYIWDPASSAIMLSSGIYVVRLQMNGSIINSKVIRIR
jgi:hypothetical protein